MQARDDRYLGDGVYASFDGYMVWLDLRGQAEGGHVCRIALEPDVLANFEEYVDVLSSREGEAEDAG